MGYSNKKPARIIGSRGALLALAAAMAVSLAACGEKKEGGSQVVAKVNDDEITIHQINLALQQQRNLRPEQADAASRQLLEQLIDQQLAVEQAGKLKLDRDPLTVQMIDAARREVLARRYLETIAQGAPKPSSDDVSKYFNDHPALFAQRKIYNFQRVDVEVPAPRRSDVATEAKAVHSVPELTDWLKSQGLPSKVTPAVEPAEALPLQIVDRAATMNNGDSLVLPQPFGVSVLLLESAQAAPKTLDQSRAAIEQFLTIQARREAVETTTKSLRAQAKVEYEGKFAASAPAVGAASAVTPDQPAASSAAAATPAASATDSRALQNGLGLK